MLLKQNAAGWFPRRLSAQSTLFALRSSCILPVEFCPQPAEIRIKRDEAAGTLKEGPAAGVVRHAIQRTLAVAGRKLTAAGQPDRRRIERKDRRVAPVRFADSPFAIECLTSGGRVKNLRRIKSVRGQQHRIVALPTSVEHPPRFGHLHVR